MTMTMTNEHQYEGRWSQVDGLVHLFKTEELADPSRFLFVPLHNEVPGPRLEHHARDLGYRQPLGDSGSWCGECAQVIYERMGTPLFVRMPT